MKRLDPFAVELRGAHLIEASAGTGKTHTITTLFLRLLLSRRLPIQSILVVTFTNAATAELRARIRHRIRQAIDAFGNPSNAADPDLRRIVDDSEDVAADLVLLHEALRNADQAAIHTIHGFCQRALSEHAFESGTRFDLELVTDARHLIFEVAQDFWQTETVDASPTRIQYLRTTGVTATSLSTLARVAVSWPDMPVAASESPAASDAVLEPFFRARGAVARAWPSVRAGVERTFRTSPALSRTLYARGSIERWLAQMTAFAEGDPESLEGWSDEFRKFRSTEIVRGTKKGHTAPLQPFFELCDTLFEAHEAVCVAYDAWVLSMQVRLVEYARSEFAKRKRERGVQTFDDLLYQLRAALRGPMGFDLAERLRRDHPAALIDEFHDTDPVQYEIFRTIYADRSNALFLIGDPKQAIYAFRGADIYAYLNAAADAAERWTLGTNYRSDPSLVGAVNTLFSRATRPFLFDEIPFEPVAARPCATDVFESRGAQRHALEIVFLQREEVDGRRRSSANSERIPTLVATEIARLLHSRSKIDGRQVEPGDVAVLTRTNAEAREVQHELRRLGIASVLHGDSSVFETNEAREMALVLRALAEPSNALAVRGALATTLLGLNAAELFGLREDTSWEKWVGDFHRWHEVWERHGFVQSIRRLLRDQRVSARLLAEAGGERKLTNFHHLIELIHQQAASARLKAPGVLQWFDDVRHNEAAREGTVAPESQQIRLESDEYAVQLTTMHRSKGLEYPVVYCPYLWHGWLLFRSDQEALRYHDPKSENQLRLDLRPKVQKPEALALAEHEALAENLRLTYVALTRAKHHCVLFWGAMRGAETSAIGYLLHQADPAAGALAAEPSARIQNMEDADLLGELDGLARDSSETIGIRVADYGDPPTYAAPRSTSLGFEARSFKRSVSSAFRVSSFSAIAAGSATTIDAREGKDRDDSTETALLEGSPTDRRVRLHDFPRGAGPGELLHSILERVDFQDVRSDASKAIVDEELARHGIDGTRWSAALLDALDDFTRARLEPEGMCLADVPLGARLNELEFTFVVLDKQPQVPLVTAEVLGRIFFEHAHPAWTKGYPQRLNNLGFAPLAGFLRGFIDLLFEYKGRFYLVDYKSNFLGQAPRDYGSDAMRAAMEHHHYFLQYHLYTVAIHRYLATRLPGYDYDTHFGGAYYLFLRGLSPDRPNSGVFYDRPTRALVEELSSALDRRTTEVE